MHVGVFADLEGAFGIWRKRQCHTGTPEWQYGRECLTEDVNAVIRGAFDGGAGSVTVKDTHDTGFNCIVRRLDRRARYVGGHFVQPTFFGRVDDTDLVLYVAIHAASGTPDAFFPHTHYGVFAEVKLNGRPVCETELYGGYLGEFGIPIGLVSGEEVATRQALAAVPWAVSIPVDKRKETYTSGERSMRYLMQGRADLARAAASAVRESSRMQPLCFQGGLHFEVVFRDEALASRFNTWGFEQHGERVEWRASGMVEGFDAFNKLTFFPRRIYAVRRPLLYCLRKYYRLRHALFATAPNREGAACWRSRHA